MKETFSQLSIQSKEDCLSHLFFPDSTLAILMGGQSERMGTPKHRLLHRESGVSLWQWQLEKFGESFSSILLLPGRQTLELAETKVTRGIRVVPDKCGFEGQGPLSALLAAIESCTTKWLYFVAVDYPHLNMELFKLMNEHKSKGEIIVPEDSQGQAQWLCGLYEVSLKSALSKALENGTRSMRGFCRDAETYSIPWSGALPGQTLDNINTPEQASEAGFRLPSATELIEKTN